MQQPGTRLPHLLLVIANLAAQQSNARLVPSAICGHEPQAGATVDGGRGRKVGRGQAAGLVLLGPGACAGHTGLAWEGSGWLAPLCPGICAGYAGQGREEPEKWVPGGNGQKNTTWLGCSMREHQTA